MMAGSRLTHSTQSYCKNNELQGDQIPIEFLVIPFSFAYTPLQTKDFELSLRARVLHI